MSIRIIKICDSNVVKPFPIIFNNCIFPDICKPSNLTTVYEKGDKHEN